VADVKKILAEFLLVSLITSGCASSRPEKLAQDSAAGPNTPVSVSQEIEVGQKIHAAILSTFPVCSDSKLTDYVNQVGLSIAAHAKRRNLPYQFTVLYDEKIYATSAPGGYVYLTTGMINFLQNEAELAAVLAHEIGELQYRDPRLSQTLQIMDSVTQVGVNVAPAFGQIGSLAALGLVLMSMASGAQGKPMEDRLKDADERALTYMVAAGYDPQGYLDVIHRFLSAKSDVIPVFYDYYQSRPISEERLRNIQKKFDRLPLQGKSFSTRHDVFRENTKGIRTIEKV